MEGQLWILEGGDGVGKSTQAKLLIERLTDEPSLVGQAVRPWKFPNYDGHPWGTLIKSYLAGTVGSLQEVGPYYASILYAADRGEQAPAIKAALASGDWIVCDRYASSNIAHQASQIADPAKRQAFVRWLTDTEYTQFALPRPTGTILLNMPLDHAREQLDGRYQQAGGKLDVQEQDNAHRQAVHDQYLRLAQAEGWPIIECMEGERRLSTQEVSDKIWNVIHPHLPS